jgi:hypothetical protein
VFKQDDKKYSKINKKIERREVKKELRAHKLKLRKNIEKKKKLWERKHMREAEAKKNATKDRLIDTIPDLDKYESPNLKADINFSKILLEPR